MKWIRRRLRSLFGLDEDLEKIARKIENLAESYAYQKLALCEYISVARVNQAGIGRIIAKWDETFAISEFDLKRKAESDKLGEEAIKRFKAEDWARRHTEGFPDAPPK